MSLTEVLPTEPVIPTTRAPSVAPPGAGERLQRRERVLDREDPAPRHRGAFARTGGMRPRSGRTRRPRRRPRARRRRTRRRRRARRAGRRRGRRRRSRGVDRRPPRRAGAALGDDLGARRRGDLLGARFIAAGRSSAARSSPRGAQLLAGDLAVVEGDLAAVLELLALLVALAGDHDRVAGPARSKASAIAARRSGSTSTPPPSPDPGEDLGDDRLRVLGARVVGGDDREVGELRRRPAPSSAACRGRGRRRRRRPRSAGPRSAAAPPAARSPASPGVWA